MDSRIPSKTFLLGEYAILKTGKALLLAHPPFFTYRLSPGNQHSFAIGSPAEKWLRRHGQKFSIKFQDPHFGKGGFGGSGAELLSAIAASVGEKDPWWIWEQTRDLGGSGADLLVQSFGEKKDSPLFLLVDLHTKQLSPLSPGITGTFSIFHTGKKLPTHEHLAKNPQAPDTLSALVETGLTTFQSSDAKSFGENLNQTHTLLREAGLQAPHTTQALATLPRNGIWGAKGCGALGSDVILVFHSGVDLTQWAGENSLTLVTEFSV